MCKTKKEFDELVARERKLSATKSKIESELATVKSDMKEYVKANGSPSSSNSKTLVVHGKGYKVILVEMTNSEPDRDMLKAIFGDKYNSILKETSYSSIRVY